MRDFKNKVNREIIKKLTPKVGDTFVNKYYKNVFIITEFKRKKTLGIMFDNKGKWFTTTNFIVNHKEYDKVNANNEYINSMKIELYIREFFFYNKADGSFHNKKFIITKNNTKIIASILNVNIKVSLDKNVLLLFLEIYTNKGVIKYNNKDKGEIKEVI